MRQCFFEIIQPLVEDCGVPMQADNGLSGRNGHQLFLKKNTKQIVIDVPAYADALLFNKNMVGSQMR